MASLPLNRTFICNYNASEFDGDKTIPKTEGQLFSQDMVLNASPSSFDDKYISVNGQYFEYEFSSANLNPFNRSGNQPLTIVAKTSKGLDNSGEHSIVCSRYPSINWLLFNPANGKGANNGTIFLHDNTHRFWTDTPYVQITTEPNIYSIRVNNSQGYGQSYTDGTTERSIAVGFGSAATRVGFFTDPHYTGGFEIWRGNFYWIYISGEALTDDEIQQVIEYNENLGSFGISPENISFDYTGGTSALTITSEEGWTASTENDWLTLSSTTGTGNNTINITAQLNKGQERIGIITVTNGNTNVSCTITQSKYPVLLYCENLFKNGNTINKIYKGNVVLRENLFMFNVDINEIEFEKSGGTQQAVINSTKKWTASAPNWITLSSYSGRSGNITITAASADTSRDGNIVIDNGVNQKIITVNQTVVRYELDLNNGEWIANGEVEGYTLYESTNNGKTSTTYSCYLKFTGQSATLMVKTDGEEYYDYVVIEDFNTGSSFWSGRGKTHNMYHTVVCNYDTSGVHTIKIKYTKDGSGNYYTDKGYFYIKEIA